MSFDQDPNEAVTMAASDLAQLVDERNQLQATLQEFAKYIVIEGNDNPDHACAKCRPHSDILKDGFVCTFHRAQEMLNAKIAAPNDEVCGACCGSGWVVRDADIGTDQECFSCDGKGISI